MNSSRQSMVDNYVGGSRPEKSVRSGMFMTMILSFVILLEMCKCIARRYIENIVHPLKYFRSSKNKSIDTIAQ